MEIQGKTSNVKEHVNDIVLNEGQLVDSIAIDSGEENDTNEMLDVPPISGQGSNTVLEEGELIDLTGSLNGLKRKTIEDIYDLYCNDARDTGFSVRKSTTRTNEAGVVIDKYFVCSCEGFKGATTSNSSNSVEKKTRNVCITRTGCKASLRVKMNNEGLYEVVDHNIFHNHNLTRKEWSHLHRSERQITKEKGNAIVDMISSGMGPMESFRYMAKDAGGGVCWSYNERPLKFCKSNKNECHRRGDAQTLIDMLSEQYAEDHDFYYKVKLDDMGRLCNVFWRDSMMKEDYKIYGDVVIFDTTYRTNRYNLICGPFVGVNNHWKNVMFGCSFIADEKVESFEWLFEVFKKSMEGRSPITLFTDQDQAIGNAIEKVFPTTRHRLCIWHLYQNALSRFGKLKGDKCFKGIFNRCLSGCTDENEFESCWNSMISQNGLEDHNWFKRLYDLREKWCTALNKDYFSAGILSSQRSESTNNAIGFHAKKTTTLTEFYEIFKETVRRWRSNEQKDEFNCSRSTANSIIPLTGILKHASEVYTVALFKDFHDEFLKAISTTCQRLDDEDDNMVYKVSHDDVGGAILWCFILYTI